MAITLEITLPQIRQGIGGIRSAQIGAGEPKAGCFGAYWQSQWQFWTLGCTIRPKVPLLASLYRSVQGLASLRQPSAAHHRTRIQPHIPPVDATPSIQEDPVLEDQEAVMELVLPLAYSSSSPDKAVAVLPHLDHHPWTTGPCRNSSNGWP